MELYIKQLEQEAPAMEQMLVAIDHTAWGRPDAKTLKDRTHQYQGGGNYWTRIQHNCVDTRSRRKLGTTVAARTD